MTMLGPSEAFTATSRAFGEKLKPVAIALGDCSGSCATCMTVPAAAAARAAGLAKSRLDAAIGARSTVRKMCMGLDPE
jgi:hypothetical protein